MKNKKLKILYSSLILCVLLISTYAFVSPIVAEGNNEPSTGTYPPQSVNSLPVLKQTEFAGKSIPLQRHDVRERFDRELMAFTYMHSTTFLIIKRANLYFPIIEPILKENGIPDDFKYLAVVESYLNPRVVSPVKAVGIWQFVTDTAIECGLEVTGEVDERYHLEKSTIAACRYLQQSYDMYGDWLLAAASYNAGRRRVTEALEEQGATDFFGLYLNEETSRYIFRLLAVKEVISNPKKYGFRLKKEDFYHTVRTEEVEINTPVENWAEWAQEHDTDFAQLKYYNLWIRDIKLENFGGNTYKVKIPYAKNLDYDIRKVKIHNKAWVE
ncbi:lytic transglycosylase domain-containing protein [Paludibacter sp. 221]|uniref:lytic transglycosylase domain-containing protein n=1 Tax=Paludibacter sp. 221 TaxID=2302939 RepID=UPI0013D1BA58|nr:lytic transglycosylase domain-containing protein [Paludibacter sp. 221]NDV46833.1 lytic transglycosylase domain-containing protein [Paludibacter sp. 221]